MALRVVLKNVWLISSGWEGSYVVGMHRSPWEILCALHPPHQRGKKMREKKQEIKKERKKEKRSVAEWLQSWDVTIRPQFCLVWLVMCRVSPNLSQPHFNPKLPEFSSSLPINSSQPSCKNKTSWPRRIHSSTVPTQTRLNHVKDAWLQKTKVIRFWPAIAVPQPVVLPNGRL